MNQQGSISILKLILNKMKLEKVVCPSGIFKKDLPEASISGFTTGVVNGFTF